MASKPEVKVSIPLPEDDKPKLGRLGLIVAACFVVGAVWPRVAGITLVPRVPLEEEEAPAAVPSGSAPSAPEMPPESAPEVSPSPASEKTKADTVKITKTLVVNCKDDQDRKLEKCDEPAITEFVTPKIQALAGCDAAQDAEGTLSLGVDFDFAGDRVRGVSSGKSTSMKDDVADRLVACAEREFKSTSLKEVAHEHARYQFFFLVEFLPAGSPVAPAAKKEEEATEASGTGVVIWESANVRTEPSKDAEVKARVLYGARLVVQARKGEWYEVKYDGRGRTGWIHQNAIGKK